MISLAGLALSLTIGQGQMLSIDVPDSPGTRSISATWNERTIPFVRNNGGWRTLVGVDLQTTPGDHPITLSYLDEQGVRRQDVLTVRVAEREFRTTRLKVAPKFVELGEADAARAARESKKINAIYATQSSEDAWLEDFASPIPGATGGRNFGHKRVFNDQPRAPHSGADLTAATGTKIYAANRGRVVLAENLFFSGNAVFVDHGLGIYTVYLHLSQIDVAVGDVVEQGEVVGRAGATGRVTGPHLHWGVRAQGARVDPFSLPGLIVR